MLPRGTFGLVLPGRASCQNVRKMNPHGSVSRCVYTNCPCSSRNMDRPMLWPGRAQRVLSRAASSSPRSPWGPHSACSTLLQEGGRTSNTCKCRMPAVVRVRSLGKAAGARGFKYTMGRFWGTFPEYRYPGTMPCSMEPHRPPLIPVSFSTCSGGGSWPGPGNQTACRASMPGCTSTKLSLGAEWCGVRDGQGPRDPPGTG